MNHAQRQLREEMARAGLDFTLDERKPAIAPMPTVTSAGPEVDRTEIRELLVMLGAPGSDLEWLTASCPSVEYALTYQPPVLP